MDVNQNATDHAESEPMGEQVERNFDVLSDQGSANTGYSPYDNFEFAHMKKLDMYMPDNFLKVLDEKGEGERRYHNGNFEYDEGTDTYICPKGKGLKRRAEQKHEEKSPLILYKGECCQECTVRERCPEGEARIVSRDGRELLLEAMRQKLGS